MSVKVPYIRGTAVTIVLSGILFSYGGAATRGLAGP